MGLGRVAVVAAIVAATSVLAACGEQDSRATAEPATSDDCGLDGDVTINGSYDPFDAEASAAIESMLADGGTIDTSYCELGTDDPDAELDDELDADDPTPAAMPSVPEEPPLDPDRPYAWTDAPELSDGFTAVLVPGVAPTRARAELGDVVPTDPADAPYLPGIGITGVGGGSLVMTLGAVPDDVVAALSRMSEAPVASYSSTVEGDNRVLVIHRGRVVRDADPFLNHSYAGTSALPEEKGLDLENDPAAASMQLLERVTGIAAGRDDVDRAFVSAVMPVDAERFNLY